MLLNFGSMNEVSVPNMNEGMGVVRARMHVDGWGKVILSVLAPGSSIGVHEQSMSVDINYVLSGRGTATCGGIEEELHPGVCHLCPEGSTHSIANTGDEDLVLFTVVAEQSE